MDLFEERIGRQEIFKGNVLNMYLDTVLLENGKKTTREFIEHGGGVCILALDSEFNVYMVRQFRYGVSKVVLELPAGKLDKGETPMECAKRELLEETGLMAHEFISLGELYPTPAYCGEITYMYLAKGLSKHEQHLDEDEFIEIEKMPLDTLVKEVILGNIPDAKTQIAVLKAYILKEKAKYAKND